MFLDVRPWVGLGAARFGMTPQQVRDTLHEREIYEDWMGGNLNDSILFQSLVLGFDNCDARGPLAQSRFCEVRARPRPDLFLFGRLLNDWSRDELTRFAAQSSWRVDRSHRSEFVFVDFALSIRFDENDRADLVEFFEPGVRIIRASLRRERSDLDVAFQGWPLREEHRCVRTGGRWKYLGPSGPIEGPGPYRGVFRPLDPEADLRADDRLIPIGGEPVVPTRAEDSPSRS